jgi:hypothetical protein
VGNFLRQFNSSLQTAGQRSASANGSAAPSSANQGPTAPSSSSQGPTAPVQSKPQPRRERTDAELKELAEWPGNAHQVWKSLSDTEHVALLVHMANRYGADFAKEFLKFTKSGAVIETVTYGPVPEYTPAWFKARGYQLIQQDSVQQWWTHPNGRVMAGPFGALGAKRMAEIAKEKAEQDARNKQEPPYEPPPPYDPPDDDE